MVKGNNAIAARIPGIIKKAIATKLLESKFVFVLLLFASEFEFFRISVISFT